MTTNNSINGPFSVTSSASTLVQRDANQNAFTNNFINKTTNVSSAAGTTSLTVASTQWQNLTGSNIQTFQLPAATTLAIGTTFSFNNITTNSTLTVKDNSSATLFTIPFGGQGYVILLASGSAAGTWDYHFTLPNNVTWGTNSLVAPAAASATFGSYLLSGSSSGTISIVPQAAAGTYNFNLPTTAGTSGQFLTSAGGGSSAMTWSTASSGVTAYTDEAISFAAAANNGYFVTAAGVTATLPASPAQGNQIIFCVTTAQALIVRANTGQIIQFGNQVSTSAGTLTSDGTIGDTITLTYQAATTTWFGWGAQGTWTTA